MARGAPGDRSLIGPLLLPTWAVIGLFMVVPVAVMSLYSFLTREFRGGVDWTFTLSAYDQFFFDRGLFGDEPPRLLTGGEQDQMLAELLQGEIEDGIDGYWPEHLGPDVRRLRGFRTELRDLMMRCIEHEIGRAHV